MVALSTSRLQRQRLFQASPSMSRLATRPRRNRFVILRTASSPPVALHPASRRRSYLRFLGCDQPRRGLAPRRQSVLTDALMVGADPPSTLRPVDLKTGVDRGPAGPSPVACCTRYDGI